MSVREIVELAVDEKSYIESLSSSARKASITLRSVRTEVKNKALLYLAELLDNNRNNVKIENGQDVENANINGLSVPLIDRLILDDNGIDSIIKSLHEIASLTDPVGSIVDGWVLPNGIKLSKVRVPIGVIAIIYESRPNVTIDIGALGIKSSNAVILRGGKEAIASNKYLTRLFQKALAQANLPGESVQLVEQTQRNLMYGLLRQDEYIDLVVPRGGPGLIQFVSDNSSIPVIKHDKGVCHLYVHQSADIEKAKNVVLNSKTHKISVCNAAEAILIDRDFEKTDELLQILVDAGVTLHGDSLTKESLPNFQIENLLYDGYQTEYLSMNISVKVVDDITHALNHIQTHSSQHTEAILAEENAVIERFLSELDSAALFVNASTRFHDGGQFGLGAEVGISTGKLHSRGPMGLADLTCTKFILRGDGQVRS